MEKDVLISIQGVQEYPDAAPDPVNLITDGRLTCTPSGYALTYTESGLTGIHCTTTLHIRDRQVTMSRRGEVNSEMIFQVGRPHLSLVHTPEGNRSIGVRTSRLTTNFSDQGGNIDLDYAVEVDCTLTGHSVFHISVREPQQRFPRRPTAVCRVQDPCRFPLLQ